MFYMFRNKEGGHDLHAHSLSKRSTTFLHPAVYRLALREAGASTPAHLAAHSLSKHAHSQKKEATGLKQVVAQNAMAVHAIGVGPLLRSLSTVLMDVDSPATGCSGLRRHHH